jgi:hypothetical protein
VPALLLLRHARKQLALRRRVWSFARVLPATFLLMVCWSLGEAIGELEAILASGKTTALPDIARTKDRGVVMRDLAERVAKHARIGWQNLALPEVPSRLF